MRMFRVSTVHGPLIPAERKAASLMLAVQVGGLA